MRQFGMVILASCLVAACGVADVGTAAATAGKMQADQAKQGQEAMDKVKRDLDAAAKAQAAQRDEAEKKSSY